MGIVSATIVLVFALLLVPTDGDSKNLGIIGFMEFAFGSHVEEHVIYYNDPLISIQDDKSNIIWQSRNQNIDSAITFTQLIDGKTTIEPKTIVHGTNIANHKILSSQQNIFVVYEQYTKNRESPSTFYVILSNDNGKTFSEPKLLLTSDTIRYDVTNIEILNEKLYIFGTQWTRGENISYVFYSVSDNFGKTFSEPTKIFNQGKTRQPIITTTSNDVIYLLLDDEKRFDEKGHLYLFKILSDGTLTEKVSVNNAETSVTNQKIAVSGDDVYVTWLDRPHDTRWFSSFTVSHDGGITFEKSKYLPSDPDSIDTYHPEGLGIFVINETLNVLWESDYWDGENQIITTFVGVSENKGKDFKMDDIPASDYLSQFRRVITVVDDNKQYFFAQSLKNYPYENSAMYFNVKDEAGHYSEIVDILKDYQVEPGYPTIDVDNGFIHIVTDTDFQSNCLLYQYSSDDGKSFHDLVTLASPKSDEQCLGMVPKVIAPLKQLANGVLKNNIQCSTGISDRHILMLKKSDEKPICISYEHMMPLIKRGYLDENSFTKFAFMTSEQFIDSVISKVGGASIENLDLHYTGQRDMLPPHVFIAGTFDSDKQLYPDAPISENGIYKYTISLDIQNINLIHKATLDYKWDLFEEKFLNSEKQQIAKSSPLDYGTILTIEDPIDRRNLLPVAIIDVDTNVNGETVWDRLSIIKDGDTRGVQWDSLPRDYARDDRWTFIDQYGNDVWDNSVIDSDNFAIAAIGMTYLAICDDKRVEMLSGLSPTIPILPGVDTVYMKQKEVGILPNSEGNYHVEFLSLSPTLVNLPTNATNSTIESALCILEKPKDTAEFIYFTEIDFSLSD